MFKIVKKEAPIYLIKLISEINKEQGIVLIGSI